jgi:hypothetical protein
MSKDKPKDIFKYMDLKDALHGSVRIPKSQIVESKDPMALRHAISEQYTEMVQKHPDIDFSILVDPQSDDINISWRKRTD